MSLAQVSARFFIELAAGLAFCPLLLDRRVVGTLYLRFIALLAGACAITAVLLQGGGEVTGAAAVSRTAAHALIGVSVVLCVGAGMLPGRVGNVLIAGTAMVGFVSVGAGALAPQYSTQLGEGALFVAAGIASSLVLGLVTGAMILGHWYLVTPNLPIGFLGRTTRWALGALYLKALLFALTLWIFAPRFGNSLDSLLALVGAARPGAGGSFQDQLDGIYLLARAMIGLVGPAVLCHMTLKTVALKATQPATGILYAATVLVLMGELFAFLGEQGLKVIL